MSEPLLSLADAASYCRLPASRFAELVAAGRFPPPVDIDPDAPGWHREELLAVLQAREAARIREMTAAGLLAECGEVPHGARIECTTGSAKAAGSVCLLLSVYGAQAYPAGRRDFRVYVKPKTARKLPVLLRQLNAQHPELGFIEVRA